MKHLEIDATWRGYPVGLSAQRWKEVIPKYIKYIEDVIEEATNQGQKFVGVCLWCTGSSGAILSGMIAQACVENIIICYVIPKGVGGNHKAHVQSPSVVPIAWLHIAVDDFVHSGRTRELIEAAAKAEGITITHLITN